MKLLLEFDPTTTLLSSFLGTNSKSAICFILGAIIWMHLVSCPVLAEDMDMSVPGKNKISDDYSYTGDYTLTTKNWSGETHHVRLLQLDLLGGNTVDAYPIKTGLLTAFAALALKEQNPDIVSKIAANWGEMKEFTPDADFGDVQYQRFDGLSWPTLNIKGKAKCVGFSGIFSNQSKVVFGLYCRANHLPESEVETALKSIIVEE